MCRLRMLPLLCINVCVCVCVWVTALLLLGRSLKPHQRRGPPELKVNTGFTLGAQSSLQKSANRTSITSSNVKRSHKVFFFSCFFQLAG